MVVKNTRQSYVLSQMGAFGIFVNGADNDQTALIARTQITITHLDSLCPNCHLTQSEPSSWFPPFGHIREEGEEEESSTSHEGRPHSPQVSSSSQPNNYNPIT